MCRPGLWLHPQLESRQWLEAIYLRSIIFSKMQILSPCPGHLQSVLGFDSEGFYLYINLWIDMWTGVWWLICSLTFGTSKTHRNKNFNTFYHPKWRCAFWGITSGSYAGMESSQWGSEEPSSCSSLTIWHGVIKSLTLIPLQTCIPPVAYMQPVLLIHELTKTKKNLTAHMKSLFLYLSLH